VALAESPWEYAVYDQANMYGRWPRTQEGYRFATDTFGAHSQSAAHGVAYTATGYQDPARLGMPIDPVLKSQTYASPLSFIGSTRRLIAWATKAGQRSPAMAVLAWVMAISAMLVAWAFILFWYTIIFGLFGVFVIPYRLIRRSSRKNLHVQRTTLATQQAMYQQQAAMIHQLTQVPPNNRQGPPTVPPPLNAGPSVLQPQAHLSPSQMASGRHGPMVTCQYCGTTASGVMCPSCRRRMQPTNR
jgi:hypothetical protein